MNASPRPAESPGEIAAAPRDRFGRPLHDLRVSVIETCNFRCPYCMPEAREDAAQQRCRASTTWR